MGKTGLINIVIAVVAIFILLFIYTKIAGPIPLTVNSVNTNKTDLFQVSGTGKASAVPDKARINLGITETSSSVENAQSLTNTKAETIIKALIGAGAKEKDIRTTNYSINPNYGLDGVSRVTGYTVSQSFEVKLDIRDVNKAIDSASLGGANLVGGIEFTLNDEKMEELENEARKEAVKKAKRNAEKLADTTGIKLGRIVDVKESFSGGTVPIFLETKTDSAEPVAPRTNITPGENNIEITITLSYQTN